MTLANAALICCGMQRLLKLNNSQASQLLSGIAVKVQNGPLRGEWSLKPEYRQEDAIGPDGSVMQA